MKILQRLFISFLFIVIVSASFMQIFAECHFKRAGELEKLYRWKHASFEYNEAIKYDPLNDRYQKGLGDYYFRMGLYKNGPDRIICLKEAELAYIKACRLNPYNSEDWFSMAQTRLEVFASSFESSDFKINSKKSAKFIAETFNKALDLAPTGFRMNYMVSHSLLVIWDSLNNDAKKLAINGLKFVLARKPWLSNQVYKDAFKYTRDFEVIREITESSLNGHMRIFEFLKKENLWQYRKTESQLIDLYMEIEHPSRHQETIKKRSNYFKEVIDAYQDRGFKISNRIGPDQWVGSTVNEKPSRKSGGITINEVVSAPLMIPNKNATIHIRLKGKKEFNIWPYMIVEINGTPIGEAYVNSSEWKIYSFKIADESGIKVLSIRYANDYYNKITKKDRDLYILEATTDEIN